MRTIAAVVALLIAAAAVAAEPQFDVAKTKLPPNYAGNSFSGLFAQVSVDPKGEFETTAQYEARAAKALGGTYALLIPTDSFEATYDADRGVFVIKPFGLSIYVGNKIDIDSSTLTLGRFDTVLGTYLGTNAFGVKRKISRIQRIEHSVRYGDRSAPHDQVIEVPVPPERAKTIKSRVRVLAIVRPNAPVRLMTREANWPAGMKASGYKASFATVDDPYDYRVYDQTIEAELVGFWVYDKQTGEVLGKYDGTGKAQ